MNADSGRKPGWGQPGCGGSINAPFYGRKRQFRNGSMSKALMLPSLLTSPVQVLHGFALGSKRRSRNGSMSKALGVPPFDWV